MDITKAKESTTKVNHSLDHFLYNPSSTGAEFEDRDNRRASGDLRFTSNISRVRGEAYGKSSTLYAFLQKRPESAEMISGIAGTRKAWKETLKTEKLLWFDLPSGEKSLREVEEFNIHPNTIKSLRVGECVVIKKYPRAQAYRLKVQRG